jgi:hypothetical protein
MGLFDGGEGPEVEASSILSNLLPLLMLLPSPIYSAGSEAISPLLTLFHVFQSENKAVSILVSEVLAGNR